MADDLMRHGATWHGTRRQMRISDEIGGDLLARDIDEAGLQGPVLFDALFAAETPVDIVVRAEDGGDIGEDGRFMLLDPADLARHQLLVDAVASTPDESRLVDLRPQFLY